MNTSSDAEDKPRLRFDQAEFVFIFAKLAVKYNELNPPRIKSYPKRSQSFCLALSLLLVYI